MLSPCTNMALQVCTCCTVPLPSPAALGEAENEGAVTTIRSARSSFSKCAAASLFPNTYFTNHESLPGLPDAFRGFITAFPKYANTQAADYIRDREYRHLSEHVCLDYSGFSLFSHTQMQSVPSSSSSPQPPFFDICYKSGNVKPEARASDTTLETAIRKRIMNFLSVLGGQYSMVCTTNRATAFKLLAESYPFHTNKKLLTVYDHESEAVRAMAESASKRGASVMSASFNWPSFRINGTRLKKMMGSSNNKCRGLFVFPLQSRMTGAKYPYLWMRLAQQRGWHMVLDASGLAPKDIGTLGLSLIQPDFIICSFFKVFGENPSGFTGFFIKKSATRLLEPSAIGRSIGVVSIVAPRGLADDFSGTDSDVQFQVQAQDQVQTQKPEEDDIETSGTSSHSIHSNSINDVHYGDQSSSKEKEAEVIDEDSSVGECSTERLGIECRGLDHAESMGLLLINTRLRCLTNWLVIALLKLRHPHFQNGVSLVKIYGPRLKFDRAAALSFNVYDWKGEKVEPALVQKLAGRSNISLNCSFLRNIVFNKYDDQEAFLETSVSEKSVGSKKKESISGINVVNCALGFLTNFDDVYRLWAFIAKFLDADFVERERWRYVALNQKLVEV